MISNRVMLFITGAEVAQNPFHYIALWSQSLSTSQRTAPQLSKEAKNAKGPG